MSGKLRRTVGICGLSTIVLGTLPLLSHFAPAQEKPRVYLSNRAQATAQGGREGALASRPVLKPITIDYPEDQSVFPPDMTPPTFLWREPDEEATAWQVDITFADGSPKIQLSASGERFQPGENDERCVAPSNELPGRTPQLLATRMWSPDDETWAAIKTHALQLPVTVTLSGWHDGKPVSRGRVTLEISRDPVGAPIFYRDVPLMPTEGIKGVIKPLDTNALPLIAWRLRNVSEPKSRLLLTGMHTCANCHSFSRDGKTFGMDMDGPENDKGLYALVPIQPQMTIRRKNLLSWKGDWQLGLNRVGFMSQVSPDGQYVLTSFAGPGLDMKGTYYLTNFKDYRFLQVFYPTRGILTWYSRATGTRQSLPGADDLEYVQTNGVWSPDGKYIVFARAEAADPFRPFQSPAQYANDPNETQIKYDLYRIPFNSGKGGRAVPIVGASRNGMSNSFPKVSPDGRWIVFVQCRNGQLMRPDSQLYIVPAEGGVARRMKCNTPLMNSWHSFSPNGRWLVFSSKSRSPYTQMFLTHIDAHGNDSPAILIENATAANRAVNIPEFVNIPPDGMLNIDAPAAESVRICDHAVDLMRKGQFADALAEWRKAVETDPDDDDARNGLAVSLARDGNYDEALANFHKAVELNPRYVDAHYNLGVLLAKTGNLPEATAEWQKAVEITPNYAKGHYSLGDAYYQMGKIPEALVHFRAALKANPSDAVSQDFVGVILNEQGHATEAAAAFEAAIRIDANLYQAHDHLASAYAQTGRTSEAIAEYQQALRLKPDSVEARYGLSAVCWKQGDLDGAIWLLNQVIAVNPSSWEARYNLGLELYQRYHNPEKLPQKADLDEAIRQLHLARDQQSGQLKIYLALGQVLAETEDPGAALEMLRKAIALAPQNAAYHYSLGEALRIRGDLEGAEAELRQALQLDPQQTSARRSLGFVLRQKGDLPAAVAELRHAAAERPQDAEVRHRLGAALLGLNNVSGALDELHQAVRLDPSSSEAHMTLSRAFQRAGQGEAAQKEREEAQRIEALHRSRGQSVVLLQAAVDDLRAHDEAKALSELRQAATVSPDFAEAHYRLAAALWQSSGDLAETIKELHAVIELDPDHARAHYMLGLARQKQGMTVLAQAEFGRALEIAPSLYDAHRALAEMAIQGRDGSRAIAEYQSYLVWNPNDKDVQDALSHLKKP